MHFYNILLGAGLAQLGLATYTLKDDYSGDNFANMFTFFTEDDPTHGYVNYVDQNTAQSSGLFSVNNGVVTMGVDHTNVASGRGRNSVRVTSKSQYNHGLVVVDIAHMPGSICGAWPAFWMTGPNWPNSGEIDIIEGVNTNSENQMTMHTSAGCTLAGSDCQGNTGCPIKGGGSSSYGDGFNSAKGGTYAMEWTSSQISIWFFSRGSEPADINSANPNPSNWGNPTGSFAGGSGCDIDSHFKNNNIVFDTTFCGDWAGQVFSQDSTCSALASSCQDYVQNNPNAFQEAYWAVNYLKVYTQDGAVSSVESVTPASSSSLLSVAQPTPSPSGPPFPSGNASSVPQPTASGAPFPSQPFVSGSSPIGAPSSSDNQVPPSSTAVSPPETPGPVATSTTTGNYVTTETASSTVRAHRHWGHPPNFEPNSKRSSRVARHLREHAHKSS